MKRKLLFITGLLLFLMGCDNYYMMCSLNPFYVEKNITLEPLIEGKWMAKIALPAKDTGSSSDSKIWGIADTASIWTIKRAITKIYNSLLHR